MLRSLLLLSIIVLFAGCETIPAQNSPGQAEQKPPADPLDAMSRGSDLLHAGFWDNTPKDFHNIMP